jgi:hypothetical protein
VSGYWFIQDIQLTSSFKGFIKGYISHEKSMVVLAKANPFPNTSQSGTASK